MYSVMLLGYKWYVVHKESISVMPWPIAEYYYKTRYQDVRQFFSEMIYWGSKKRHKWFRREKKALMQKVNPMYVYDLSECNSLDCFQTTTACSHTIPQIPHRWIKEEETEYKEANMANYQTVAITDNTVEQRHHLSLRLDDIWANKLENLRSHFKTDPVPRPKTLKELFQKIKEDDYIVDSKFLETKHYDPVSLMYNIRWTKEKADDAGFEKAQKAMHASYQEALDTIKILSLEEGLKALREFEARSFL